jgi:phage terminase large subunit GpA-like protein
MMSDLIRGFLDGLRPIKRLTVSEWSDEFRFLDSQSSAEPGRWRTDRTPYLREIMDALSDTSEVQQVVFMKGAQIGGSECGFNWVGYTIDIAPAPMLMVMPTAETVKTNSSIRIDPLIEACPTIKQKIGEKRSKESTNTIQMKKFPGGFLKMAGANSAAGLRSMPIRKLFLDEVDAYPVNLDEEGSPIDLAIARTKTFGSGRKILIVSTPTIEGASAVESMFLATDQRKYFVPCPHCEHKQTLRFEQLTWEAGRPDTARMKCEKCEELIEERHKPYMLQHGEWRQTAPQNDNYTKVGFHINSFYSPYGWYSWANAAEDWERAKGDEEKEITYINTVLGETVKVKADVPEWESIYNRRSDYKQNTVPSSVLFLTCGVDIQKDRIELEIVGWCLNNESYSIDYRVLHGDTTLAEVWDKLAAVVTETWRREDESEMPLSLMAVDSGYNTNFVYDFCRRFDVSRVIPVKGDNSYNQKLLISQPKPVDISKNGQRIGEIKIWLVGASLIKSEIYANLRRKISEEGEIPKGYMHFPMYGEGYFKGLVSERLQTKTANGYTQHYWFKFYERNEPLDCRVYARAAASVLGYDRLPAEKLKSMSEVLIKRKAVNKEAPTKYEPKTAKKKRDSFW